MTASEVTIDPFRAEDRRGILEVLAQAMPADPISEARFVKQPELRFGVSSTIRSLTDER